MESLENDPALATSGCVRLLVEQERSSTISEEPTLIIFFAMRIPTQPSQGFVFDVAEGLAIEVFITKSLPCDNQNSIYGYKEKSCILK